MRTPSHRGRDHRARREPAAGRQAAKRGADPRGTQAAVRRAATAIVLEKRPGQATAIFPQSMEHSDPLHLQRPHRQRCGLENRYPGTDPSRVSSNVK